MKSAEIKVGGFYAVKSYQRRDGIRGEVLAVGAGRYASDSKPGRYVVVRVPAGRNGAFYESRVTAAAVLREWTSAEDDALRVEQEHAAKVTADRDRLSKMVEAMRLGDDVVVSYRGLEFRSDAAAIALLERVR